MGLTLIGPWPLPRVIRGLSLQELLGSAKRGGEAVKGDNGPALRDACIEKLSRDARHQTHFVWSDKPSRSLLTQLTKAFPNIRILSIDAIHLVIVYEQGFNKISTPGSRLLRLIVNKFYKVDLSLGADTWGPVYKGKNAKPLNAEEQAMRDHICEHFLSESDAKAIVDTLNPDTPFRTRLEYITAIAALVSSYLWVFTVRTRGRGRRGAFRHWLSNKLHGSGHALFSFQGGVPRYTIMRISLSMGGI